MYICKSCCWLYSGVLISLGVLWFQPLSMEWMKVLFVGLYAGTFVFSFPPLYKQLPRSVRSSLRLSMGIMLGFIAFLLFYQQWLGVVGLLTGLLFWVGFNQIRKRNKLRACDGCPELNPNAVCSGYAKQFQAIKAYEAQMTDIWHHSKPPSTGPWSDSS